MDLGYKAGAHIGVRPAVDVVDPQARSPDEVSAEVGVNPRVQGVGSVATAVGIRGCRPRKPGSSARLGSPLIFLGPSLDVRGFVPALPCIGILGLDSAREKSHRDI